jgi:hypothetical protein
MSSTISKHVYEVRPRKDHRGFDLISDALPFGRLWYGKAKRNQQRKVRRYSPLVRHNLRSRH